jgi:hypothetical protein
MRWYRFLLLPVFGVSALFLSGALGRNVAGPGPSSLPPPPEDPAATRLLTRAVERLKPERMPWVEAAIWQQMDCADLSYQASGRYLAGPDNRMRLDLTVRLGQSQGEMHVVSDGTTLTQSSQVGGGQRTVKRTNICQGVPAGGDAGALSPAGDGPMGQPCFAGLAPLLQGLRSRMQVTGQEALTWNNREVIRLTLYWSPAAAQGLAPAGKPWPAYLPRKCLLYLDAASLWPYRLEWWGPNHLQGRDQLVFQMEFRDPVLNQPLSPERCAREFTFDPGPAPAAGGRALAP